MRAYFGTAISENQVKTPEGFLICRNVPIARTGFQDYQGQELGLDSAELVRVFRSEDEVFSAETMASFEGKSVTHPHPPDWINPSNAVNFNRGHAQNVKRGERRQKDLLLADLVIIDAVLINQIENGLREVSCGYNCEYVKMADGTYQQRSIIGNHIAVVQSGRAGDRVAIQDAKEVNGMSFWDKFKALVKDASPDELKEAAAAGLLPGVGKAKDGDEPHKADCDCAACKEKKASDADWRKQITDSIAALSASVAKLAHPPAKDALEKLEEELEKKEETGDEDLVPEKMEEVKDGDKEPDPDDPGEKKEKKAGEDHRVILLDTLRTLKPAIAMLKDEKERKKASDALAALVRGASDSGGSYGDLLRPKKPEAVTDSASKTPSAPDEYGKAMKDKYHRKPLAGR